MDAELAASVIDDAFQAFGRQGCRYEAPAGGPVTTDLVLIRHRRAADRQRSGMAFGRGGFETTDKPEALLVRRAQLAQPEVDGVFVMPTPGGGEQRFRIGEDPTEDDVNGIAWRCAVVAL